MREMDLPQGLVIQAEGTLGIGLIQGLLNNPNFVQTNLPPHLVFDGKHFRKAGPKPAVQQPGSNKALCKHGCGNVAKYPIKNPDRCSQYAQQCPEKKKIASDKQRATWEARANEPEIKDLPEKEKIETQVPDTTFNRSGHL